MVTIGELERNYGPFADTGRTLLDAALKRAERLNQALDVIHVLMIVARDPWPVKDLANSPTIRQFLGDPKVANVLLTAVAAETALRDAPPAVSPHTGPLVDPASVTPLVTDALDRCLDKARTRWSGQQLTDAMIVWAVLSEQNAARTEMANVIRAACPHLSLDDIVRELEQRAERVMSALPTVDHTNYMPTRHESHPTVQHHVRHEDQMQDIRDAITELVEAPELRRFVLMSGHNGSLLHESWRLLPDAVEADPEAYGGCTGVWVANMSDYLTWADPPLFQGADTLLREGIQYVHDQGGLLVLEHIEKLRLTSNLTQTPLQRELLGQLREVPGALIVALYETQLSDDPDNALNEMGMDNQSAEPVALDPYDGKHALNSLKAYFAPDWEERGFVFEGDLTDESQGPFCDILKLLDGARFREEPMTLPYLLVKLTEHLMSRRATPRSISAWAMTARDRVDNLTPPPGAQVKNYYDPLLRDAMRQVIPLVDKADFVKRGDHFVITRAHLTTTFLGSKACRFVYPSRMPQKSVAPPPDRRESDITAPLMQAAKAPSNATNGRNHERQDTQRSR